MRADIVTRLTKQTVDWRGTHRCEHGHTYLEHPDCLESPKPTKRVGIFADTHCGHKAGLTHPKHEPNKGSADAEMRRLLWELFINKVNALKPFDVAIFNGDMIDGKAKKDGGRGIIEPSQLEQAQWAASIIEEVGAPKVVETFGTAYHTGTEEDFEATIKDKFSKSYSPEYHLVGHGHVDVNGCIFDIRHKVASSQIPHGRLTAVKRAKVWADIWRDAGVIPQSDIIIRSHVHYHEASTTRDCLAMTTPALQGLGNIFGERICDGMVEWGFLWFDVESSDNYDWHSFIPQESFDLQKVDVISL